MATRRKVNHPDPEEGKKRVIKGLVYQLSPLSHRLPDYRLPRHLLVNKLKEIDLPKHSLD